MLFLFHFIYICHSHLIMIEILSQKWPWYISGPLISLIMFLLMRIGGRFGISSTLQTLCSIGGAGKKIAYFNINWKAQIWNLVFVLGALIGGFIAVNFLGGDENMSLSQATVSDLENLGIAFNEKLIPETFDWSLLFSFKGIILFVLGGFLIGFGTRWADGCTSGHAISGLSNLQPASLLAVIGFFIGGLTMTHFILPYIL